MFSGIGNNLWIVADYNFVYIIAGFFYSPIKLNAPKKPVEKYIQEHKKIQTQKIMQDYKNKFPKNCYKLKQIKQIKHIA